MDKLAELVESSQSTISRIESGLVEPSATTLYRISKLFSTPIDTFFKDI